MTMLDNQEVKLIQLAAENNPVLALAPSILSLSEPLPFVKKTKLPSILNKPEKYLQPLDIVKIKKHNQQIKWLTYWHAGIYLGNGNFCHLEFPTKKSKQRKIFIDNWNNFLKNAYRQGERERERERIFCYSYRPLIPYKKTEKILEQVAKLIINGHWKYNLLFRNCEHFVNRIIYGINFSEQVQYWKTKLLGKRLAEKKINLKKEIIKNDRLIDNIKIKNQAELINKIKEIREYTQ